MAEKFNKEDVPSPESSGDQKLKEWIKARDEEDELRDQMVAAFAKLPNLTIREEWGLKMRAAIKKTDEAHKEWAHAMEAFLGIGKNEQDDK